MLLSIVHHYQRAPVARSEPASSCSERGPALGRLPFWTDPPCSASTASSARRSWTKVRKTFSFAENGSSKMEGAEQSNCYWCQLKSKLSTGIIRKCLNPQSWLFMTPIKCVISLFFPAFFKLVSSCFVTTIKCPSSVFFFWLVCTKTMVFNARVFYL